MLHFALGSSWKNAFEVLLVSASRKLAPEPISALFRDASLGVHVEILQLLLDHYPQLRHDKKNSGLYIRFSRQPSPLLLLLIY
jgi:hypothetical protein